MKNNHKSYIEYFSDVKKCLKNTIDDKVFEKELFNNLLEMIKENWEMYETEQIESYLLSEDQFDKAHESAWNCVLNNALIKFSELGLVSVSVEKGGELSYAITEKGRKYVDSTSELL